LGNDYNYEMNDNDIADQLRLIYRTQRFLRNQKWWWALFIWGYEVSMVNSYMCIKRYCELKGVEVPWTHHDWNEAIGYAHLDPEEDWQKRKSAAIKPASVTSASALLRKRELKRLIVRLSLQHGVGLRSVLTTKPGRTCLPSL